MTQMMHSDRGTFLRRTAVGAGAVWVSALQDFAVRKAYSEPPAVPMGTSVRVGLTLSGQVFTFAKNNINLTASPNGVIQPGDYRQSEWAGACYSPDGRWLFVNIQSPGITFAITGPWHKGPI